PVYIHEDQYLVLQHGAMIRANHQMEQSFDADEMDNPHNGDADDGGAKEEWNDDGEPPIGVRQVAPAAKDQVREMGRNQIDGRDHAGVDENRAQRMHIPQPPAALVLDVEFFK